MDGRDVRLSAVMGGLLLSATAFLLSPLLMPASYSWVAHTLSQAASQGQEGGWLSRLGFLIGGLTILRLSSRDIVDWTPLARAVQRVSGTMVLAAIAFTDRSWEVTAPYDRVENIVHSAVATMIAVTFSIGVLLVLNQKWIRTGRLPIFDSAVLAIQIVMPPMMLVWVEGTGVIERVMFGAAYIWYGWEALRCAGRVPVWAQRQGSERAGRWIPGIDLRRFLRPEERA